LPEIVEYGITHGVCAVLEPLSQGLEQTLMLVVISRWTRGLGDAIGVKDETLSGAWNVLRHGVPRTWGDTQGKTV